MVADYIYYNLLYMLYYYSMSKATIIETLSISLGFACVYNLIYNNGYTYLQFIVGIIIIIIIIVCAQTLPINLYIKN